MIKITGRKLYIPQSDKIIGFEGDNLCETRLFLITDRSLFGLSFKLDVLEYNCCIDLDRQESDSGVLLTWNITSGVTQNSGLLNVQVRGFDEKNELVWHSEIESFFVGDSVNASKQVEDVALTEFEQIEKKATLAKNEASGFALAAGEHVKSCDSYAKQCEGYVQDCADSVASFSDILDTHEKDSSNPHGVTASQVGAYTSGEVDSKIDDAVSSLGASIGAHANEKNNPHNVTAEQIGAFTKDETNACINSALGYHENCTNPHNVTAEQVGSYTKEEIDEKLVPAAYSKAEMEFTDDNVTIVSGQEYASRYGNSFSTSDGEVVYRIAVSGQVEFGGNVGGASRTITVDGKTEVPVSDEYTFSYSGEVKEYVEIKVYQASVSFESFTVETSNNGFMTGEDKAKLDTLSESLGDIDTALDELHAYAQGLISGGVSE